MSHTLHYGRQGQLNFDIEPRRLVAECGVAAGPDLTDLRAATAAALAAPFEFPPLAKAIVPGDQAVVSIEPGTPGRAALTAAVVEVMLQAGVEPGDIRLLETAEDRALGVEDAAGALDAAVRDRVRRIAHDPHDAAALRYLASTAAGERVYLNHEIVDADVLVPIGCSRCDRSLSWLDSSAGVYPTFSNQETRQRYRRARSAGAARGDAAKLTGELREAMWLLGTSFAVQAIAGNGGGVQAVLAGGYEAVRARAQSEADRLWRFTAPRRAALVIAAIAGGGGEQTWRNIGRALAAATAAVAPDGVIALCGQVDRPAGASLGRIGQAEDLHASVRAVQKERPDDALEALQLAVALDTARVYLLSELPDTAVEELGITPLGSEAEVQRLAHRSQDVLLLANAQHAALQVAE